MSCNSPPLKMELNCCFGETNSVLAMNSDQKYFGLYPTHNLTLIFGFVRQARLLSSMPCSWRNLALPESHTDSHVRAAGGAQNAVDVRAATSQFHA